MIRFLLLTMLLCGLVPVLGDEPQELPKDLAYSDVKTGVVFPARLGKFHKTEIRLNSNAVVGTIIRYEGDRIGCAAHVYIYALSEKPHSISREEFMEHWEKVRAAVLNPKARVEEAESVQKLEFSRNDREYAMREVFSILTKGGGTYYSELLLLPCGDQAVKLRITVPKAEKAAVMEAKDFIREFCKLFFPAKPAEFKPAAETASPVTTQTEP